MEEMLLFLGNFLIGIASIHCFKKINLKKDLKGIDINKRNQPTVPESLGIALLIPLGLSAVYLFLAKAMPIMLAWFVLIFVFCLMGYVDDKKNKFMGKTIPWIARALPIAVVSLLFATIFSLNLIWIFLIALFIAGTASFENTFAGLNGWEIGSGFIVSVFCLVLLNGTQFFFAGACLSGAIFALLFFNKYPAKVFPGDSGTLLIGSGLAGLLVLTGKIEVVVAGFLLFIPHMVDFFLLKLITNTNDMSQQGIRPYKLMDNGKLTIPDYSEKTKYDFAKLVLKIFGPMEEWKIVLVIWAVVAANGLIVLKVFGFI